MTTILCYALSVLLGIRSSQFIKARRRRRLRLVHLANRYVARANRSPVLAILHPDPYIDQPYFGARPDEVL